MHEKDLEIVRETGDQDGEQRAQFNRGCFCQRCKKLTTDWHACGRVEMAGEDGARTRRRLRFAADVLICESKRDLCAAPTAAAATAAAAREAPGKHKERVGATGTPSNPSQAEGGWEVWLPR